MPYIYPSSYKPPRFMSNKHIQTVYHSEFRRVDDVSYKREKIDTPDGDFLNIDWARNGNSRAAIVVHGLESSTTRPYMKGMIKALSARGFDCAALNLRGCGGEMNRTNIFYNAAKTDDLDTVVSHIEKMSYDDICLIGFSLGGNIVLRYVGEKGKLISKRIKRAAAVSAPCDLTSSGAALEKFGNIIYNKRFVKKLYKKMLAKNAAYPGSVNMAKFKFVKSLGDYDNHYTAPMFGFSSGEDYYKKSSSKPLIDKIAIPTLLINAQDDPFLGKGCFPVEESERSSLFYFEDPEHGGHIGFLNSDLSAEYWHETRVADFLQKGIIKRPHN